MRGLIVVALLCVLSHMVRSASDKSFKVNVYTRHLGLWGKDNVLICHVSQLSPPPEVKIDLLKNKQLISGTNQSDLAFDGDWHYYLTKHVDFHPVKGEQYTCMITHKGEEKHYEWEPDE